MDVEELESSWVYQVVVNTEEQYSIWPDFKGLPPAGWRTVGKKGSKAECLAHISEVWTDMRPLSLRKQMEEMERRRPEIEAEHARRVAELAKQPKDPRDDLVQFLANGEHPVEAALRPARTCALFKDAIDRGYVHIRFTDTRGGTELGVRLDREASDLSGGDFEAQTGEVRLVGKLVLNYVPVRCEARIRLGDLGGTGKLTVIEGAATASATAGS